MVPWSILFLNFPQTEHVTSEVTLVLGPLNIIALIMWIVTSNTVPIFFY